MNVDNCVLVTLIYRAIEFDVNDDLKTWNIDDDGFTSETCLKNWSAQSLFCINYVLVRHKRAIFYKKTMGYFWSCNLSQTGIETRRLLGTSCSSKFLSRYRANIGKERLNVINSAIQKAFEQKHAILMMIDDYHNGIITYILSKERQKRETQVDHMHGYHHHHQDCKKSSSH